MQYRALYLYISDNIRLRLPKIVHDTGDHLGGEASLMRGVAQLGELLGEITIEIDPALELFPGCVWSQGWRVTDGQLCAAVVFVYVIYLLYLIYTTKLLKINELCKFFFEKLLTMTMTMTMTFDGCFFAVEAS